MKLRIEQATNGTKTHALTSVPFATFVPFVYKQMSTRVRFEYVKHSFSPDVMARSLNSLPDVIGHRVAPHASEQIVKLGVASCEFFDPVNKLRALFGE